MKDQERVHESIRPCPAHLTMHNKSMCFIDFNYDFALNNRQRIHFFALIKNLFMNHMSPIINIYYYTSLLLKKKEK
jgi:hypothetical protein